jgi:hypothetical protein
VPNLLASSTETFATEILAKENPRNTASKPNETLPTSTLTSIYFCFGMDNKLYVFSRNRQD